FGWLGGVLGRDAVVDLDLTVDEAAVDALLDRIDREVVKNAVFEGKVEIFGREAIAHPPRPGTRILRSEAKRRLVAAARSPSMAVVEIPLEEVKPVRTKEVVVAAARKAEVWLSGALSLEAEVPPRPEDENKKKKKTRQKRKKDEEDDGRRAFSFAPTVLAAALRSRLTQPVGEPPGIELFFDPVALEPALTELRPIFERAPLDARFRVSSRDEVSVLPSRSGVVVNAAQAAAALAQAADSPSREAELPLSEGEAPGLSTADAEALKIEHLVSKFTTRHPCCRPRVKNIHRIADLLDGVVIRPGDKFSINEFVGPRTTAKGFFPAPTIVRGEMKDTIGGGISQFATTFFNAAFMGGYEIVERQPHSYYFPRYPKGHEATLSFPKPDVIIRNDTAFGLLIKTVYSGRFIQVRLYGNNEGRKVKRVVSDIFDTVDPEVELIADDSLEPDEEKLKERGQKGWSMNVSRIIEYPDGTNKKETRKVTYKPRVRKLRVHSCKIPEGEEGHTGEPCPEPEEEEEGEEKPEEKDDSTDGDASSPPPDEVPPESN
ncbi:MAG: VanW family protein, partial [Myxococcota bacterium]